MNNRKKLSLKEVVEGLLLHGLVERHGEPENTAERQKEQKNQKLLIQQTE